MSRLCINQIFFIKKNKLFFSFFNFFFYFLIQAFSPELVADFR